MFYKSLPFEVKADESKRTFTGFASKFGNLDLHGDVILKGAFAKTIQERHPKKMIKVLWQHTEPIGIPEKIEETDEGLYVEGRISKTRIGDDSIELMKDGVVDGMSIGYDVVKDDRDEETGIRYLKELKLYEVSVVTWGANPEAGVLGLKSLQTLNSIFKDDDGLKHLATIQSKLDAINERLDSGIFGTKDGNIIINMEELKAGRVLSKKNRSNLEQAVNLIDTVLKTEEENGSDPLDEPKDDEKDMQNDPEFKSLLDEIRSYSKRG